MQSKFFLLKKLLKFSILVVLVLAYVKGSEFFPRQKITLFERSNYRMLDSSNSAPSQNSSNNNNSDTNTVEDEFKIEVFKSNLTNDQRDDYYVCILSNIVLD